MYKDSPYKYRIETHDDIGLDSVLQCNSVAIMHEYYMFKCDHIKTYRYNMSIYIFENSTNRLLCSSFFTFD